MLSGYRTQATVRLVVLPHAVMIRLRLSQARVKIVAVTRWIYNDRPAGVRFLAERIAAVPAELVNTSWSLAGRPCRS
ncbi:hypothetical protein SAMN05444365_10791 [Micromonospora pattaloongensis]|uniref:Uncharacterized protein n=1 Tax=Micromonospora pattaloongensis TaxID=405436 RepID=A0A1H3R5Y6_9ACTN|nr:hypothetical protein [Micromonospora pattaloongensis]SDZ21242.1 hypothetical protein SAMN05444365_10791 [Micromonospora pattaloongensis]